MNQINTITAGNKDFEDQFLNLDSRILRVAAKGLRLIFPKGTSSIKGRDDGFGWETVYQFDN